MGYPKQSFIKKNRLFLIIVSLILLLIGSFISFHYFNNPNDKPVDPGIGIDGNGNSDNGEEPNVENKEPEFSLLEASDSKDVISVKWRLEDHGKKVKSVQLYANEKYVADVSGYSVWSMNKSTYGLTSGEVNLKLTASFEEASDITRETSLQLHTNVSSQINIDRVSNQYTISITYSTNNGTELEVPRITIAGLSPELFTVVSIPTNTKENETIASYLITVDPTVEAGFVLNGRFIFDTTGDVKDFSITIEKD